MILAQNSQVYKLNQIEDINRNALTNGLLIFFIKEQKNGQWKKDNIFNNLSWSNWMTTCKKNQNRPIDIILHTTQFLLDQKP